MSKKIILNGIAAFLPEKHKIIAINGGQPPLSLSIPASRCLSLLITHQGEVIPREHFFQEVWLSNGAQVTNNTFYQNISLLRRAFKEFGLNEEFIVTVPKVGIKLEEALQIKVYDEDAVSENAILPSPTLPIQIQSPDIKRRTPSVLRQGWIGASALVLILCIGAALLTWQASMDKLFTKFEPLTVQNNCSYFVNPDTSDYKKHRSFVSAFNLNCEIFRYIYLTAYNNFARFSVVACQRPASIWRENLCVTHYIITDNPHAPEK